MRILTVCLGNICRSPLAHGILQREIERRGLTDWSVDSAGTGNYHAGDAPDPRSIAEAKRHGIDISKQTARQLEVEDFERFDLLLVMDASNYQQARALARNEQERDKVRMIMNFERPGWNEQVPDPYWDDDGFAGVFGMLERAINKLISGER